MARGNGVRQAPPSQVVIDTDDIFVLENTGTETIEKPLHGKMYRVEPGQRALIPFDLIRVWWGDPRSRKNAFTKFHDSKEKGTVNKRELELRRLGGLYGCYTSDVDGLVSETWPPGSIHAGTTKHFPPPARFWTQGGQEIIPACFDRTGDKVYAVMQQDSQDLSDEATYREHLLTEMDRLRERLDRLDDQSTPSDVEVDSPTA